MGVVILKQYQLETVWLQSVNDYRNFWRTSRLFKPEKIPKKHVESTNIAGPKSKPLTKSGRLGDHNS